MLTDDMISQKAGVIVAKIKQVGSIVDRIIAGFMGLKRTLLAGARTYNVLSISPDDSIESLNLQNIDGASSMARENIIKNVASGAGMPAKLISEEVFVAGFGEGTEDAKNIAHYIDGYRRELAPIFKFLENIVMVRAWNKEFFETVQRAFPDAYGKSSYQEVFFQWRAAFSAIWPSLLTEPDSEKIKVDETRLKSTVQILEVLMPQLDPENKARLVQWALDAFNENKMLFSTDIEIDGEALAEFFAHQQELSEQSPMMPGAEDEDLPVPTGVKEPKMKQAA